MRTSLFVALTAVVGLLVGCGDEAADDYAPDDDAVGDDDVASDDDVAAVPVEITETYPVAGATDVYHRNDLIVWFDGIADQVETTLVDDDGDPIEGVLAFNSESASTTVATFDPYGESENQHLDPSTAYTATVTWVHHDPVTWEFVTSEVGAPVTDVASLVGRDFRLDLASARFTQPTGVGSLLGQYLGDLDLIAHIASIEDTDIQIHVGSVEVADGAYTQDLCDPTLAMTSVDGDPGPGLFDNPYVHFGPGDLHLAIEGYEATLLHVEIGVSFTADGAALAGGTLDTFMEVVGVGFPEDPGAECDLLETLGIECVDCPDGSGEYCLPVSAFDMAGERVDVSGVHPETGEPTQGLVEVTEEMITAWRAEDLCP